MCLLGPSLPSHTGPVYLFELAPSCFLYNLCPSHVGGAPKSRITPASGPGRKIRAIQGEKVPFLSSIYNTAAPPSKSSTLKHSGPIVCILRPPVPGTELFGGGEERLQECVDTAWSVQRSELVTPMGLCCSRRLTETI